jgi:hypothetical protein
MVLAVSERVLTFRATNQYFPNYPFVAPAVKPET